MSALEFENWSNHKIKAARKKGYHKKVNFFFLDPRAEIWTKIPTKKFDNFCPRI